MSTVRMKVEAIVVSSLLMGCAMGFAQSAGGGRGGAQYQGAATSGSRLQDRDRLSTHSMDRTQDRLHDRTQDRLHDRTQDRLHDRTQDRLHDRDLLQQRDRDRIYGSNLMTAAERAQYEEHLGSLATAQERVQFRMEHQHEMQARAEQRGMTLSTAPTEAQVQSQERQRQREREQIYGYSKMTPAEVARYEQQMRNARTAQERERIRAEHRKLMQARTRERTEGTPR